MLSTVSASCKVKQFSGVVLLLPSPPSRFYLFIWEREQRVQDGGWGQREREKQTPG